MPLSTRASRERNRRKAAQDYYEDTKNNISRNRRLEREEARTHSAPSDTWKAQQAAKSQETKNESRQNQASQYPGHTRNTAEEQALNAVRKVDQGLRNAASTIKRSNTNGQHYYSNPTASGDGRGGAMDREWKNHKWISRERGKDGKWIYEYGDQTSGGGGPSNEPRRKAAERAYEEQAYKKAANARQNLESTWKRAPSRNTGRPKDENPLSAVTKTAENVAEKIQQGSEFISKFVSDAVANTPFKDLFK